MASDDWSKVDVENESIDPRIHTELERLNTSTDLINKLERDLDLERSRFRDVLYHSSVRLDELSKKLGSCIEKARPYYDARIQSSAATKDATEAAYQYEKANSAHTAAREMVYLAEQGLEGKCTLDPAWQEMMNHATERVNEAETARARANIAHMIAGRKLLEKTARVQKLQKELKRSIAKSRPYFEMKAQLNYQLEIQKNKIQLLEKKIQHAKTSYAEALNNLEKISNEIHNIRRTSEAAIKQTITCNDNDNKTATSDNDDIKIIQSPSTGNVQRVESSNAAVYYNQTYVPDSLHTNFYDFDQFRMLPNKHSAKSSPIKSITSELIDDYKSFSSEMSNRREADGKADDDAATSLNRNSSNEWTEIDLEFSSPEDINLSNCTEDIPYQRLDNADVANACAATPKVETPQIATKEICSNDAKVSPKFTSTETKPTHRSITRQVTMPDPSSMTSCLKLDSTNIVNWISRSNARDEPNEERRQSLDNILGPVATEKVKNIFSQASNMLNITNLNVERRDSEPKLLYDHVNAWCSINSQSANRSMASSFRKIPSTFDKTMNYLVVNNGDASDDAGSDTDSIASCDMLTEEQIQNLMLDKDMDSVCEKILGTPMTELCISKLDGDDHKVENKLIKNENTPDDEKPADVNREPLKLSELQSDTIKVRPSNLSLNLSHKSNRLKTK